MGALDLLNSLQKRGLRLSATGECLRAEPKAAITDEARNLIRAHKAELLAALRQSRLESMTEECAEFYAERAAIAQYDGNLSLEQAEAEAQIATGRYRRDCWRT